jgi:hypothetical protein
MKKIELLFFSLLPLLFVHGQNKASKFHSREVIVQKGDTLIRTNILTGEGVYKTSEFIEYFYYSKGMINSNIGDYGGKLLNGNYKAFLNNKLIETGQFSKGCKTGLWRSWYLNGKYKKVLSWKNGKPEGDYKHYNEDGSIDKHGRYKSGKYCAEKVKVNKVILKKRLKSNDNSNKEKNSNKVEKITSTQKNG